MHLTSVKFANSIELVKFDKLANFVAVLKESFKQFKIFQKDLLSDLFSNKFEIKLILEIAHGYQQ